MKANELRIGNWFIEYEDPQQFDGDFYHLSDIKFIPLTEEWLLKFGAKQELGCVWLDITKDINPLFVSLDELGRIQLYKSIDEHCDFKKHIQYVHSLQNLYFALTGEELTIKENDTTKELEGNNG